MYLLDDWGMGDTETRNRKYAEQSREHLLARCDQQDGCDEVDLHPLSNQVRNFNILLCRLFSGEVHFWVLCSPKEVKNGFSQKRLQIFTSDLSRSSIRLKNRSILSS